MDAERKDTFAFVEGLPGFETDSPDRSTDYLIIGLNDRGNFSIQGSRNEVEKFLLECARSGLVIRLDHLSWCG